MIAEVGRRGDEGGQDEQRGARLHPPQAGAGAVAGASAARARRDPGAAGLPVLQGKLVKLGEDVTETLEVIPRQWKVIQTVREKFTCRSCEKIAQPPAPFHPIARGRAGAGLLAMVLFGKYGNHLPLNRQSEGFAREGIDLDVSTLADWVGACAAALSPLVELIRRHVLGAARIHGDDTTVPVLAKGKTESRPAVDLRPRRSPIRRAGPTGGGVLLLPQPRRRAPGPTSRRLRRNSPGRRLCRLQRPLRSAPKAGADHRGGVLEPRDGASSSSWRMSPRRRWRSKRCAGSM